MWFGHRTFLGEGVGVQWKQLAPLPEGKGGLFIFSDQQEPQPLAFLEHRGSQGR